MAQRPQKPRRGATPDRPDWRSALVIPIPEADAAVDAVRRQHDPSASEGMPAHVTLMVPFLGDAEIDGETLACLGDVFRARRPFAVTFARFGRFPQTVYLAPAPSRPFVQLTEALVAEYPHLRPYEGAFDAVVPHLTLANFVGAAVVDSVERAVAPHLPIHARVKTAWLLERIDGRWRRREEFPLGRA